MKHRSSATLAVEFVTEAFQPPLVPALALYELRFVSYPTKTEGDSEKSRRELLTRLLPDLALSALAIGVMASPARILSAAIDRFNERTTERKKDVEEILSLLGGVESLNLHVVGPGSVQFVLSEDYLKSCAVRYLVRLFRLEGAEGAPSGLTSTRGGEAKLDYVIRLPHKNIYLKIVKKIQGDEVSRLLDAARSLNPSEVWIFAEECKPMDVLLDPVFVSENKVLRGRLKLMTVTDMLYEFFEEKLSVSVQSLGNSLYRVTVSQKD